MQVKFLYCRALPPGWQNGSVTGLKARGGFEVDMSWANGKLVSCNLKSILGNSCLVRYAGKTKSYDIPGWKFN